MRTRAWLTTGFVILISTSAFAQRIDPEFTKARQARTESISTGNQAVFERYTADGFIVTGPTGQVEDKAERVGRANRPIPQSATLEDEKITPYGDDTIVLTWRQGSAEGGGMRFLEVWVKERGTWKVAAVQLTPIQAPR